MEEGVGADMRQAPGSLLDLALYVCTRAARASMRDEADWVWSVSSILSVLLAGLES